MSNASKTTEDAFGSKGAGRCSSTGSDAMWIGRLISMAATPCTNSGGVEMEKGGRGRERMRRLNNYNTWIHY
jgi:hypothetical protein